MHYDWLAEYGAQKPGASRAFKPEWDSFVYLVAGKLFVMEGGDKAGKPIITVKLEPLRGDLLRQEYPDVVIPGYYMNKTHWNSVYRDGNVPDDVLKSMIDESYKLIVASLPRKTQQEIES